MREKQNKRIQEKIAIIKEPNAKNEIRTAEPRISFNPSFLDKDSIIKNMEIVIIQARRYGIYV